MLLDEGAKVSANRVQGWWKDTGKPQDLLEANQLVLNELESLNNGTIDESAIVTNNVGIGNGSVVEPRTTIRGPAIIGENCVIGPNVYVGPYTSIGDHVRISNTEIENSIVMEGTVIDCGKKITDSLIGKNVEIVDSSLGLPRGHRLVLGDASKVAL